MANADKIALPHTPACVESNGMALQWFLYRPSSESILTLWFIKFWLEIPTSIRTKLILLLVLCTNASSNRNIELCTLRTRAKITKVPPYHHSCNFCNCPSCCRMPHEARSANIGLKGRESSEKYRSFDFGRVSVNNGLRPKLVSNPFSTQASKGTLVGRTQNILSVTDSLSVSV